MGLGRFGRACGFGVGDMSSVKLLAAFKIQMLTTVCKWPIPADCTRRLRCGLISAEAALLRANVTLRVKFSMCLPL